MLSYDEEANAANVRTAKRDATRLGLINLVNDNLATSCSCPECAMATETLREVLVASGTLDCRCGRQVLIVVSHAYSAQHKWTQPVKPSSIELISIYALLRTSSVSSHHAAPCQQSMGGFFFRSNQYLSLTSCTSMFNFNWIALLVFLTLLGPV